MNTTKTIEQILSLKSKIDEMKDAQRKDENELVFFDMQTNGDENKENMDEKVEDEDPAPSSQ